MPWFSVAVTTLENNVKGTLKINSSRVRTWTIKKSYFMAICFCIVCEVPDMGSRNVPQPVMPSQPLLHRLAPALPTAVPLPHWGRQIWKSCGKVHLQSSCLCLAFVFAPTEVKPSGWSAVNKLSKQLNFFSCLWIYKWIPISSKSVMK